VIPQQDVVDLSFARQLREVDLRQRLQPGLLEGAQPRPPLVRARHAVEPLQRLAIGGEPVHQIAQLAGRRRQPRHVGQVRGDGGEGPVGGRRLLQRRRLLRRERRQRGHKARRKREGSSIHGEHSKLQLPTPNSQLPNRVVRTTG
jgi:hypothetical protein